MFTEVHHVNYVVHDVDQMAGYLEENFGMKPEWSGKFHGSHGGGVPHEEGGYKYILYRVGSSIMEFYQPIRDDTALARQLKERGPGVVHVSWRVKEIDQLAGDLIDRGGKIRGDAALVYHWGYKTINIETSSSHGLHFQLSEGDL